MRTTPYFPDRLAGQHLHLQPALASAVPTSVTGVCAITSADTVETAPVTSRFDCFE